MRELLLVACGYLLISPAYGLEAEDPGGRIGRWQSQLRHSTPESRVRAVKEIAEASLVNEIGIEDRGIVLDAARLLKDKEPRVRAAVATAFPHRGPEVKASLPIYVELLRDTDASVRVAAATWLARLV
jgi:hypothetical protein